MKFYCNDFYIYDYTQHDDKKVFHKSTVINVFRTFICSKNAAIS